MTDMDAYHEVGILPYLIVHLLGLVHNILTRPEDMLEFLFGLIQVASVVHGLPAFLAAQELEDFVPSLIVGNFPCQPFVIVPSVATFQIPWLPKWEKDKGAVE